jgi:hypothetical protein
MILVDCFSKCPFSIPYYKNIDAKEAAWLYIYYIYWIYGLLDTIISNCEPQFILAFWKEFTWILGIKLKFFMVYYPQMDG